jgi:hypothetical protein
LNKQRFKNGFFACSKESALESVSLESVSLESAGKFWKKPGKMLSPHCEKLQRSATGVVTLKNMK